MTHFSSVGSCTTSYTQYVSITFATTDSLEALFEEAAQILEDNNIPLVNVTTIHNAGKTPHNTQREAESEAAVDREKKDFVHRPYAWPETTCHFPQCTFHLGLNRNVQVCYVQVT